LLLVSHDRRFLDNVVTQTIAAEGRGRWREYVGGYTDWVAQRAKPAPAVAPKSTAAPARERAKTKLSYKEQRELAALPEEIEALEREQTDINARMSTAEYHRQGADKIREDRKRLEEIETLLLDKFARWEALEELRGNLSA
jgi:ATP-binding cassette subfamily F protein uup